ncbi:MAG: hypothetical protein PHR28_06905 [candidate division Zixibacteria bacterium]|nr:hypothetical protein [candidate division Zixibacteria bacterium]
MDQTRQIRLLIAPFFFFATLISAQYFADTPRTLEWMNAHSSSTIAAIAGLLAAATLPVGFLINTVTVFLLRILFWLFGKNYEADITKADFDLVLPHFDSVLNNHIRSMALDKKWGCNTVRIMRYIAVTFDHDILYRHRHGIHEWLTRVFSVCMVSASSVVAVFLALIVICLLPISTKYWWDWTIWGIIVLLSMGFWYARDEVLEMTRFQMYQKFETAD